MQHQAGAAENLAQEGGQRTGHLAKLGEDQHLLLLGGDHLGDFAQARPFAAVLLRPDVVAQPLRGMVADLLEPHQHRQHDALALDALGLLQAFRQVLDGLGVQRGLPAAEAAQRLDLGLVGQIGDDRLVGLHPAQDVGPHQFPQRAVRVVASGRPGFWHSGRTAWRCPAGPD